MDETGPLTSTQASCLNDAASGDSATIAIAKSIRRATGDDKAADVELVVAQLVIAIHEADHRGLLAEIRREIGLVIEDLQPIQDIAILNSVSINCALESELTSGPVVLNPFVANAEESSGRVGMRMPMASGTSMNHRFAATGLSSWS